jgi:hypothetical protein
MKTENFIRILAGTVVLGSLALAHWVHPNWLWLTAFAGGNLIQSAFTGFCPPTWIMQRLGWIDDQGVIRGLGARKV